MMMNLGQNEVLLTQRRAAKRLEDNVVDKINLIISPLQQKEY